MTQAALAVEVIGEVIYKDGRRVIVTNKAIPEYLKFLISFILNESAEDISFAVRSYEELRLTIFKIMNLK